jgi:phosphoserine phosphatase
MYDSVATIVHPVPGGLDKNLEKQAAEALKGLGVERLEIRLLEPGRAADIVFSGGAPELRKRALAALGKIGGFDIFVQANDDSRKKKLLMADMDATIIQGETLDEMAAHFNLKDKIAPITARAMRGELDFFEALKARVSLLKGMPVEAVFEVIAAMQYNPGAKALVATMGRFGGRCVLISGGFDLFTSRVARGLGFHKDYANRLGMNDGRLTGEVIPPIVDKDFKKKMTEEEARKLGLLPAFVMAVGDGANDIPMLQTAGAGVGYYGKPAVVEATPHQVRYTDLSALLFMQGYRREEFA